MKTAKVHVSKTDINNFSINEMKIDPVYDDLYNPQQYKQYKR